MALTWYPQPAQIAVLIAATCCASSLHIYLKHFRLTFQFATWIALLCALLGWHELALGGALVTLGGLCFKEYFCFRVPLLNLQPAFVAALWFAWVFEGGLDCSNFIVDCRRIIIDSCSSKMANATAF